MLGNLPTHAGLVWTDGEGVITFEAFDRDGILLGTDSSYSVPNGGPFTGETAEDRFYGVIHNDGIKKLVISKNEVDHIQYGFVPPEPEPESEPTLRIDKFTNVDGTFDFVLTGGVSPNTGFITTDGGFGSNSGFVIVSGITYTLSEDPLGEGWSTTIICEGSTGGENGSSTITANDGDVIVCTVTNTFTAPPEPEPEPEKNNPCDALDKASENGKGKKKGLERAKANNNC